MTHLLQAIAWTLIHFCWQAAAVAAIYRVLSLAIARLSSNARYLAALAALMLTLAISVVTFAWELSGSSSLPTLSVGTSIVNNADATQQFPRTLKPGADPVQPSSSSFSLAAALPWIDGFWVLGVLALSIRSLGGWWLIRRLQATANSEVPTAVRASFRRISRALDLHRPVLLRVSSAIAGPITVGTLRAMVLLPLSAITSLGTDELEVVLAHELAHVRRADFFWNLAQTLAETLFFFHPAVWWINARIRYERELCCDDLALQVCPNRVAYADALFRLEEQRSRQWRRLAMAFDGHQSPPTLRLRIARILGEPAARTGSRPVRPFSLIAACAGLIVLLLPVPQLLASFNPVQPASPVRINPAPTSSASAVRPVIRGMTTLVAEPASLPTLQSAVVAPQEKSAESSKPKANYIDEMKAAGYDVDLDKYIAMKVQGITPEYARAMAQIGFGKPNADELIACKIQGVTPEYIAKLKQQGFEVKSLQDAISYQIFQVTPEFVAGMKEAGFDNLTSQQLLSLRVQGVTPEYARKASQQFPGLTVDDLLKTRIFRIDDHFIAMAKKHGFTDLTLDKLVQLRISGLFDDESVKP